VIGTTLKKKSKKKYNLLPDGHFQVQAKVLEKSWAGNFSNTFPQWSIS
jgi:hypothetical protein